MDVDPWPSEEAAPRALRLSPSGCDTADLRGPLCRNAEYTEITNRLLVKQQ
jgi:hypothetical protein